MRGGGGEMEKQSPSFADLTNKLTIYSWKPVDDIFSRHGRWLTIATSLLIGVAAPGGMYGMGLIASGGSNCIGRGRPFYLSKTKTGATGIVGSTEHPDNLYFIDEKQRPQTITEDRLWISALLDRGAIFNRIVALIGNRDSELDSYCQSLLAVGGCIQIQFISSPWPKTEADNSKRMKAAKERKVDEDGQLLIGF
jgi:hypothetical protein